MWLEAGANGSVGSASAVAAVSEATPLLHTQLQESPACGLGDSRRMLGASSTSTLSRASSSNAPQGTGGDAAGSQAHPALR